jgi:putative ABC transport system ATP-binding protein
MIDIHALDFHYPGGDFRLHIPHLHVEAREKLAVIGPSGSGKTTLLNLVAGILTPQWGDVRVGGRHVNGLHDSARRDFRITNIGLVLQDFELLEYLSVIDNVLHPYRITRALRLTPTVRSRAEALLWEMGIGDKLKRNVDSLSQGEKQRIAICRALLPQPHLILADEATGNLDPRNKMHILDLLFAAVDATGTTLLAVTHDHELLPRFDRTLDFSTFLAGGGS